jgi:hypothetical protein
LDYSLKFSTGEFESLLLQIDKMYPLEQDLLEIRSSSIKWKYMIEIPILCRIGTFLRMLFSFDDITERHQSKFAETVNKIMEALAKENESPIDSGWNKLFVIEDWFTFMRYRKRIVNAEMYNSRLYNPIQPPNLSRLEELINRYSDPKGKDSLTTAQTESTNALIFWFRLQGRK